MFRTFVREHSLFLTVIAPVLLAGFLGLGSIPLTDVDEGVFSETSREMVETGDWVTPRYNYDPRYDKPILFYWLQSTSFLILGTSEFAARFPSACAGALLTILLYLFCRRHLSGRTAFWATLAWLFCLETFVYSRAAVTDMSLALFLFGATAGMFNFIEEPERRGWLRLAYASAGLAFLTKGLIGVVVPGAVALVFAVTQRRKGILGWFDPIGLLLFVGIALPWYAVQTARDGGEFLRAFFLKHHLQRYTGVISGHEGPWYYFLGVVAVGFFPWVGFLPAGVAASLRSRNLPLGRYALVWGGFVIAFFSLSGTKLPNYILSAFPALAILAGVGLESLRAGEKGRGVRWAGGIVCAIGVILAGGGWYVRGVLGPADYPTAGISLVVVCVVAAALWGLAALVRGRPSVPWLLPTAMLGVAVMASVQVLPMVTTVLYGELRKYGQEAAGGGEGGLVAFRINNPSLAFYAGGKVEKFGDVRALREYVEDRNDVRVVALAREDISRQLTEGGFRIHRRGAVYHLYVLGDEG